MDHTLERELAARGRLAGSERRTALSTRGRRSKGRIPHFPDRVETLFLGLVYSGPIASAIVSIEPDAAQWAAARTEPAADACSRRTNAPDDTQCPPEAFGSNQIAEKRSGPLVAAQRIFPQVPGGPAHQIVEGRADLVGSGHQNDG